MNAKNTLIGVALILAGILAILVVDVRAQQFVPGDLEGLFVDPDRFVRLHSGDQPFRVPPGKVLVITTLSGSDGSSETSLNINGVLYSVRTESHGSYILEPGVVLRGGDTVSVAASGGTAGALGKLYLEGRDPGF